MWGSEPTAHVQEAAWAAPVWHEADGVGEWRGGGATQATEQRIGQVEGFIMVLREDMTPH